MNAGVYIDDAGTPGVESNSRFLPSDRKSWAAVVIPESAVPGLRCAMRIFIDGIKSDYDADELHFTDIYSGRREFKGVPTSTRFQIIELMSGLFQRLQIPILYQTSSPGFLKEAKDIFKVKGRFGNLDFDRHEHFSLFMLLCKVKEFLKENTKHFGSPLPVIVDAGMMKVGAEIKFENWRKYFTNGSVSFADSKSMTFIQLADFAAFVISRTQWLVARGNLNEIDIEFIRIVSANKLQLINLPLATIDPRNNTTAEYDRILKEDRLRKGLSGKPPQNNDGVE